MKKWASLTAAHCGHGEESPPEAVEEGPVVGAVVLLGEVDEAGEGEDRDADEHDEQAQLPRRLPDGEEERLQTGKVPHELEDAQDLGHAHQPHNLARFPDDVELCTCNGPLMFTLFRLLTWNLVVKEIFRVTLMVAYLA